SAALVESALGFAAVAGSAAAVAAALAVASPVAGPVEPAVLARPFAYCHADHPEVFSTLDYVPSPCGSYQRSCCYRPWERVACPAFDPGTSVDGCSSAPQAKR